MSTQVSLARDKGPYFFSDNPRSREDRGHNSTRVECGNASATTLAQKPELRLTRVVQV